MSKPRLTPDQKLAVLRAYRQGEGVKTIAARFGIDNTYPSLLAKRRGLVRRSPRPPMSHRCPFCGRTSEISMAEEDDCRDHDEAGKAEDRFTR